MTDLILALVIFITFIGVFILISLAIALCITIALLAILYFIEWATGYLEFRKTIKRKNKDSVFEIYDFPIRNEEFVRDKAEGDSFRLYGYKFLVRHDFPIICTRV